MKDPDVCLIQKTLVKSKGKGIMHDFKASYDTDGCMMLKCRSCGYVRFDVRNCVNSIKIHIINRKTLFEMIHKNGK